MDPGILVESLRIRNPAWILVVFIWEDLLSVKKAELSAAQRYKAGQKIMDRRSTNSTPAIKPCQTLPCDRLVLVSFLLRVPAVTGVFVFCQMTALWGRDLIVTWALGLKTVEIAESYSARRGHRWWKHMVEHDKEAEICGLEARRWREEPSNVATTTKRG